MWTTAIRETSEEIGDVGPIQRLGLFHDAKAITGAHVTPAVAFLRTPLDVLDDLSPNPAEVDNLFTLTLAQLSDPGQRSMQDLGIRGHVPVFQAGPVPVWGLTAYILDGVLREVVFPAFADAIGEEDRRMLEGWMSVR